MSKPFQPLWIVTLLSQAPGEIQPPAPVTLRAAICTVQDNGSLFFGDAMGRTKIIIAKGQWLMVEKESERE